MSHYLYAFGEAASTDCSLSHTLRKHIDATMSLDQSSYADNTQVKLCVRLQSLGGTSTAASDAYEMTWNKSMMGIYTESNDIIIGGNSGETLIGGLGGDTITGGTGEIRFILTVLR